MSDAAERAVSTAEDLEAMEDPDELDPLEVKITADLDGTARRVVAVLTVGGPHIEADLTSGTVTASWGGDSHTTHFNQNAATESAEAFYLDIWESNTGQR